MIDVHRITDDDEWNTYVDRAAGGSLFHRHEFLTAIASATGTEFRLLVGKNGEHPIGILPLFVDSKGPLRLAYSPPPHAGIPHLGPAMMLDPNIKYRKATLRTKEFVEACIAWLDDEVEPHYVRIVTNTGFEEVRPFRWRGFDVTPRFTYELDIDRDDSPLLRSFSRDARSSIQDHYRPDAAMTDGGQLLVDPDAETDVRISDAGSDTIEFLAAQLDRRFTEQGETFPLSADFLQTVADTLPDGAVRVYRLAVDGEPVTGRFSLVHDGRLTFWQGVPKPDEPVDAPINDLLNWHSIREARAAGCDVAELSGANIERLWDYKAKFNPELATYYILERTSTGTKPLLKAYKWWHS